MYYKLYWGAYSPKAAQRLRDSSPRTIPSQSVPSTSFSLYGPSRHDARRLRPT